jgi:hypothetical protein
VSFTLRIEEQSISERSRRLAFVISQYNQRLHERTYVASIYMWTGRLLVCLGK